jgi:microcystin degradation protein MlrC
MRIAVVGISYEALLRSPVPTPTMEVDYGPEMIGRNLWMVRGIEKRFAEANDVELVPILWGTALPGGGFTNDVYTKVKQESVDGLRRAGKLDGVVIVNHGAMEVHGLDRHADSDYVEAVAQTVGPDVPLALALDLHGHISPDILKYVSAISVLRTAPHRDDLETGYRAADQLLEVIRTGQRQHIAAIRLPILIPGEQAVTHNSPARELYGMLPDYDARPGMVEANVLVGFAWNDRPWVGMTAIAQSSQSLEQATEVATEIANKIWAVRKDFQLRMEHAEVGEGLDRAATSTERPLFISDSGDNTTAGAAGDLTTILQEVLKRPELEDVVVAGITAPGIVQQCQAAGVGATITLRLGEEHQSAPKTSVEVEAVVEGFADKLKPDGFQPYLRSGGAWARVRIGHVIATFHDAGIGMTTPAHFTMTGIHPTDHRIYVVKLGYLHPQLEDVQARHILLLSDGSSNLDVTRLSWSRIPRPAYPVDADASWTPEPNLFTTVS